MDTTNPYYKGYLYNNALETDNKQVIGVGGKRIYLGNGELDGLNLEYGGKSIPVSDLAAKSDLNNYLPLTGGTLNNGTNVPFYIQGAAFNEASIGYINPQGTANWIVGSGAGGTSGNAFGFYRADYGTVAFMNETAINHVSRVNAGTKAAIFTDGEGGTLSLVSPNGREFHMDAFDENIRMYTTNSAGNVCYVFHCDQDGWLKTNGYKVLSTANFSLSGSTLTITT